MIRTWKMLTMYSLLSAATVSLAPPPVVFADEPKFPAKEIDAKALKELSERVMALENKKLTLAEKDEIASLFRAELQKLKDGALADLRTDMKDVKKTIDDVKSDMAGLQAEQNRLKFQLEQQRTMIDLLAKKVETIPSTPTVDKAMLETLKGIQEGIAKMTPPTERKMMSPPSNLVASTGSVMLINMYKDDLLFIINNVRYRVPANGSRLVENVPAGSANIEVAAIDSAFSIAKCPRSPRAESSLLRQRRSPKRIEPRGARGSRGNAREFTAQFSRFLFCRALFAVVTIRSTPR